jgi:hypothetical protein
MATMQQAEQAIDTISDMRMQLMYLEDNAHHMTEEDLQCLKNVFHKTTSLCKVVHRRNK